MSKRRQQKLETRLAIYEAALARFEQDGYEDTSVEQICEAAGVGRATFFRHFETKAGLLRELNRRLAEDAARRIDLSDSPTALAKLQLVSDAIHDAWIDSGPGQRSLGIDAASLAEPGGHKSHPELSAVVAEIVEAGVAGGELQVRLPLPLSAHFVVFHLAATTVWWMVHPDQDLRQLLDDALDQCLLGIAQPSLATPPRT